MRHHMLTSRTCVSEGVQKESPRSQGDELVACTPECECALMRAQVSQRPDAAEILERLQASTPGLATASSRSLTSAASASLPSVAAGAVHAQPLQQPLSTIHGSSGTAASGGVHDPSASAVSNPFAAQYELLQIQLQEQGLRAAAAGDEAS